MAHLCSQFPCLITGPLLAVGQQPLAAPAQGVTATQGNATYFEVHQSWCGVAGVPGANGVYGVCGTLATSKSAGDPGHAISMVGAPDRVVGSSSGGCVLWLHEKKGGPFFVGPRKGPRVQFRSHYQPPFLNSFFGISKKESHLDGFWLLVTPF